MVVVILDSDQIPFGISRRFVKLPNESTSSYQNRITHLHAQNQKICQIGDLNSVRNLSVLYLYDNRIEQIERLEPLKHLRMLYLQGNKIKRIQNLNHLTQLKKLYLSNNQITVIEGLDHLINLEELHIDRQQLEEYENVVMDPRTAQGLKSLKVLSTSYNNMKSIASSSFEELQSLKHLNIRENSIDNLNESVHVLSRIPTLTKLMIAGNPIMKEIRAKEALIAGCQHLCELDDKLIQENSRTMIKRLKNRLNSPPSSITTSAKEQQQQPLCSEDP